MASHLPHRRTYVEACAGMASVLLARPRSPVEVLNDVDGRMVTWWRVLRDHPDDLAEMLAATPYSQAEFTRAAGVAADVSGHDDLTVAWAVAVCLRQSTVASLTNHPPEPLTAKQWLKRPTGNHLSLWERLPAELGQVASRMRRVALAQDDVLTVVERYAGDPGAVLYVDPPYAGTLDGSSGFQHDVDRDALVVLLSDAEAAVAISGYPSCPWDELGWRRAERTDAVRGTHSSGTRTECLWMSYPAAQHTLW